MNETSVNEERPAEEYRRLNKKCMLSMYINNAITYAILLTAFLLLLTFVPQLQEPAFGPVIMLASAGMVLLLIYLIAGPKIYYDRYRYIITADKVDVRYGIVILRHILVPIERVHQVEVSRGPVNNMLGLANVNITTAGGVATISYLELDEAEKIAERLNDLINRMLRDRSDVSEELLRCHPSIIVENTLRTAIALLIILFFWVRSLDMPYIVGLAVPWSC